MFGLVGESGCGKTTTGRSIIKLYDITSGSIYYKGKRIAAGTKSYRDEIKAARKELAEANKSGNAAAAEEIKEKITSLRKEITKAKEDHTKTGVVTDIQMIFQDPIASLDGRMTVRETIAEGLMINGIKDKKVIDKKVFEILEMVGLVREHATRYPHEFSGGQPPEAARGCADGSAAGRNGDKCGAADPAGHGESARPGEPAAAQPAGGEDH